MKRSSHGGGHDRRMMILGVWNAECLLSLIGYREAEDAGCREFKREVTTACKLLSGDRPICVLLLTSSNMHQHQYRVRGLSRTSTRRPLLHSCRVGTLSGFVTIVAPLGDELRAPARRRPRVQDPPPRRFERWKVKHPAEIH